MKLVIDEMDKELFGYLVNLTLKLLNSDTNYI